MLKIPAHSVDLRKGIIFLVITTIISLSARRVDAQSGVELENVTASYRYGEQITFTAQVKSSVQIRQPSILINDEANGLTQVQPLSLDQEGRAEYRLDVNQNVLRPFSSVKWKYELELA